MEPGEHLFRREAGRMVAALTRIFGLHNLALAEDVVQDAFCRALEIWQLRGVPDNPSAWLMRTAKNRAIDVLRRERTARDFEPALARAIESEWTLVPTVTELFAAHAIKDDQLRMMFTCCHPRLSEQAQVALVLNLACGFTAGEIAHAFLSRKAGIEKRISRAKKVLAASPALFDLADREFAARLSAVHRALYLLFNEGYHGASAESTVRAELCREAMRLGALLLEHPLAATPATYALCALMHLHAARLPARVDAEGGLTSFFEQDRSRWDRAQVTQGERLLERSATGAELSEYHVEAAIASVHARAPRAEETDWASIVRLYDTLLSIRPSPVVALNRAIAIAQLEGPQRGLEEIRAIADPDRLAAYPFYSAALGELELRQGRHEIAREHFRAALALARSPMERRFLERRSEICTERNPSPGVGRARPARALDARLLSRDRKSQGRLQSPQARTQRTGKKSMKHAPMRAPLKRMARVKLYPSASQEAALVKALDICRQVYNVALEQRRDAWRSRRLSIKHREQYAQLTELRHSDARIASIYRELLDAALRKLDLAFAAFFRRARSGEQPGFPRFRSRARYGCLEFPHGDRAIKCNQAQDEVRVPGVGSIRLRKGRRIGPFGRAMLVRTARGWYALFECRREPELKPHTGRRIGLDRGIATFIATSEGEQLHHPRLAQRHEARMASLARVVTRRKRGGTNRRKAVKALARAHDRLRWARRDFAHKLSRAIINSCDVVAIEALKVRNMLRSAKGSVQESGTNVRAKARLNFAIADASWTLFASMLHAKAEEAGRTVIEVDPRYTSQTCSGCGRVDAASRVSQAVFICTSCGLQQHADVNAATVILKRAELAACGEGRRVAGPQRSTKRTSAGADPVRAASAA